jgi:hypothetical protein
MELRMTDPTPEVLVPEGYVDLHFIDDSHLTFDFRDIKYHKLDDSKVFYIIAFEDHRELFPLDKVGRIYIKYNSEKYAMWKRARGDVLLWEMEYLDRP